MSSRTKPMMYLNRYTSLPFLLDALYNKRLMLVDPARWEDENDSYFMKLYKEKSGHVAVLALCFVEDRVRTAEKYHNWKIYAGNSSGVCIQFARRKLIAHIESIAGITHGSVTYMTIGKFESARRSIPWRQLPFVKRKAFDGETEFRIIYESDSPAEILSKDIPIDLSIITKITLNPWIPGHVYNAVCNAIQAIDGCKNIPVTQTTVLNYARWKKAGERIVELNRPHNEAA